jgi:8-oxo-dGTP pyrophosphatase MutT (NUDIX family)
MFDGSFATFEALYRRPGVNIIATTSDGNVIINYEEQPHSQKFVTLPGGNSETNNFLEDAKRELLEETGFQSSDWVEWKSFDILKYEKLEWSAVYFIAKDCKKVSELNLDPGEKIDTVLCNFQEFLEISQRSDFRNKELQKIIFGIQNDPEKLKEFKCEIFESKQSSIL